MTLQSRITDEARNIMDEACLPEAMVKNGTDAALRSRIAQALVSAEQRGREMEREEVRKPIRNAILSLSPSQRRNGDILDDTIAAAITEG